MILPNLPTVYELLLFGGEEPPSDQGRLDLDLLDGQLDVDVLDDDLGFGRGFGRGGPPAGDVRAYHLNQMKKEIISRFDYQYNQAVCFFMAGDLRW